MGKELHNNKEQVQKKDEREYISNKKCIFAAEK